MKYIVRAAHPEDGKERNLRVDAATPLEAEAAINARGLLVASVRPDVAAAAAGPTALRAAALAPRVRVNTRATGLVAAVRRWLRKHRRWALGSAAVLAAFPLMGWWINLGDSSYTAHTRENSTSSEGEPSSTPVGPRKILTGRSGARDLSVSAAPEAVPAPIVTASEAGQLVVSKKMPLGKGLMLTVSFVILDPNEPRAAALEGVAGIVLLENLDTLGDHTLNGATQMALRRGTRRFTFDDPEPKRINEHLTAVDYSSFEPSLLRRFLAGPGDTDVEVDGRIYPLGPRWSAHLGRVAEETERQLLAMREPRRAVGGGVGGRAGGGGGSDLEAALAFMRLTGFSHEEMWPNLERSLNQRRDLTHARREELKANYLAHETELFEDIAAEYLRHFSGAELRDMTALQLRGVDAGLANSRMRYIVDRMKVETPKLNAAVDRIVKSWMKRLSE